MSDALRTRLLTAAAIIYAQEAHVLDQDDPLSWSVVAAFSLDNLITKHLEEKNIEQ